MKSSSLCHTVEHDHAFLQSITKHFVSEYVSFVRSSILFTIVLQPYMMSNLCLRDLDLPTRGRGKIVSRDLTFESK